MANRGYLCAGRTNALYPSVREPKYDAGAQTIAASVSYVPVLWLAGFTADDVVFDDVKPPRGKAVRVVGMIASRTSYLRRLPQGAARLAVALGAKPSALAEHAARLAEAVREVQGKCLSTELEEIASLRRDGVDGLASDLRAALAGDPGALARVSGWEKGFVVPSADVMLGARPKKKDALALDRLLGHAHERDVPWEPAAPPPPKASPLYAAMRARNEAKVRSLIAAGADLEAAGPWMYRAPAAW